MEPWQQANLDFSKHVEGCVVCRTAAIGYRHLIDSDAYCKVGLDLALTAAGLSGYGPRKNLAADD